MRRLLTILFLSFLLPSGAQDFSKLNLNRGPFAFAPSYQLPQVVNFALDTSSVVSIGIRNSDSFLIRTLISIQRYSAGAHLEVWDGLDDFGNQIPAGVYTAKVVSNNISFAWEGGIGNTSSSFTGYGIHKGNNPPSCMCISGGNGYYGLPYNEASSCTHKFSLSAIQSRKMLDFDTTVANSTASVNDCATDGAYVYWMGRNPSNNNTTFVYVTEINTDTLVSFSSGTSVTVGIGGRTYSGVGLTTTSANVSYSIALSGSYLYISRPSANRIDCYNKSTGAFVSSTTTTNPASVRTNGNVLWCSHATTVEKFSIAGDGSLTSVSTPVTGLVSAQAIAIHPVNGNLYVADGGTSQQIKIYNTSGVAQSTWGVLNGYRDNAISTADKWYWNDAFNAYRVFLCFGSSGDLWVNDPGNCRIRHYNSSQVLTDSIQWIPFCYNLNVDDNNPTRIFSNGLEYSRDYSQTLSGSTGWTQVANWRGQLSAVQYSQYQGLISPLTYGNGKTYCLLGAGGGNNQLTELKSDGTIRSTGFTFPFSYQIDKSGNLYSINTVSNGQALTQSKMPFTGNYDGNGTPLYSSSVALQSSPVLTNIANEPVYRGNGTVYRANNYLSDSTVITYDGGNANTGYHLGAFKGGKWLWKQAAATYLNYAGNFTDPSRYDVGNTVGNAGGCWTTVNNLTYANYYGEFWKQSQTNINNVYDAFTGLPVYQIGVAYGYNYVFRAPNLYGDAGNDYAIKVIAVNGVTYLQHNDESIHGIVHSWRGSGLNTVKRYTYGLQNAGTYYTAIINNNDLLAGFTNNQGNTLSGNNYPKWTFSNLPFYNIGSFDYWNAATGRLVYSKTNPDLYLRFASTSNLTRTATCDLTSIVPNGMKSWILDLTMTAPNSNANFPNGTNTNKYVDLLDTSGKIICRYQIATSTYPAIASIVNTTALATTTSGTDIAAVLAGLNRLVLTGSSSGVQAQLTTPLYSSADTPVGVFQTGANPLAPATLKISFVQNGSSPYGLTMDIQKANFYPSVL